MPDVWAPPSEHDAPFTDGPASGPPRVTVEIGAGDWCAEWREHRDRRSVLNRYGEVVAVSFVALGVVAGAAFLWVGETALLAAPLAIVVVGVLLAVSERLAARRAWKALLAVRPGETPRVTFEVDGGELVVHDLAATSRLPLARVSRVEERPLATWIHLGYEAQLFLLRRGVVEGSRASFLQALTRDAGVQAEAERAPLDVFVTVRRPRPGAHAWRSLGVLARRPATWVHPLLGALLVAGGLVLRAPLVIPLGLLVAFWLPVWVWWRVWRTSRQADGGPTTIGLRGDELVVRGRGAEAAGPVAKAALTEVRGAAHVRVFGMTYVLAAADVVAGDLDAFVSAFRAKR